MVEASETFIKNNAPTTLIGTNLGIITNFQEAAGTESLAIITVMNSKATSFRNQYRAQSVFTWTSVGTAKGDSSGHFLTSASTQLKSIVLTPGSGVITGTYSTVNYY